MLINMRKGRIYIVFILNRSDFFLLSIWVKCINFERYFMFIRRYMNIFLWGWDGNKFLILIDFNSWWDIVEYDNIWGIIVGEMLEIRLLLVKLF